MKNRLNLLRVNFAVQLSKDDICEDLFIHVCEPLIRKVLTNERYI